MRNDREIAFLALGLQRLTARAADVTISFSAEELTLRDGDIFERPELVHMVSGDLWGDLSLIRALIRYTEISNFHYVSSLQPCHPKSLLGSS